jgi:prepilin-type processing-associated H-X9-DG protein
MAKITTPANLAIMWDGTWGCGRPYLYLNPNEDLNAATAQCGTGYIEPHNGGVNIAFADGHAKWAKSSAFWAKDKATMQGFLPWANAATAAPGW